MEINEIMTKSVVTVELDDTVRTLKDIFDNVEFHHVLVISSGTLYGVISDRDLLKNLSPNIGTIAETYRDLASLNKKAHLIMTRKPVTLPLDASNSDAVAVFNNHRVSCIPVVDENHKPKGVLSWRDLLKVIPA